MRNTDTTIICITGKAGAGKDTLAALLKDRIVGPRIRLSLADTLKTQASKMLDEPVASFYNRDVKENYRTFLQGLGDARKAQCGNFYWVNCLLDDLQLCNGYTVIVPDARFDYEVQKLAEHYKNVIVVEVVSNTLGTTVHSNHSSENGLDRSLITHTIYNDGTIADLDNEAAKLLEYIGAALLLNNKE